MLPAHYADVGSRGVVVTDRLRVRAFAGLERDILEELGAGTELLLREGPLTVDGLDWYEVFYPPCTGGCDAIDPAVGWVAVGPAGAEPTMVRVDPPRCPRDVPPTAGLLAAMGGLARTHCFGGGKLILTAVIDTCQEGPLTPWTYEPSWMWFSCYSAFDLGSPGRLPLHFGPDSPDPAVLSRGSVVKVEGHMMDDAYRSCHIKEGSGGVVEDPAPVDQEYFVLHCLSSFVVTRLEVIGSVDLPTWPR